ncbi:MAG: 2OG-Fe(II) oxygenase [Alphaproteobacteria bacterium]|nr:2OG-Fe(II) oxygenase [Alphaproteobacteria bacterium]
MGEGFRQTRRNAPVIDLDLPALRATPVEPDPFPHVVVPNFVPPTALAEVVRDLPPIAKGGSFPPDAVRLGPRARALVAALEGPEMRAAIAERFSLDLADAPTMLTVRGRTREKDGRIHCDSTAKRVTVLLYLNPETDAFAAHQGCLRLLRGPDDLEDFAVEVPPVNGTLLAFPNGPASWHGHKQFVGERYSMQLNYMTTDQLARSELRRHRVSAFVKRLTRAA